MTNLILPTKAKRELSQDSGKDKAVGISPWQRNYFEDDIIPKSGKWRTYYDMYTKHAIVHAAIEKIAKTATNVGYDFVPRDSRTKIKKGELKILQEFFMRQHDFIFELRRIYKDLLIYGDAFMYIIPNKSRQPHSLKRLHPNTMAVKAAKNGDIIGYVQFNPQDPTNTDYVTFQAHEIMHFKLDDPDNDLYGLSPLSALEGAVATDLWAQQYNASFFANSGVTGTIISVSGVDPDEIERNRKFLIENYTGPQAAHKPIFLEGQNVSVAKSVATHNEMGFLQGREFIIMEILAVLDVPPAKMGMMESANRSNSKEQDKSFRSESISPLQYIVESVINAQFIQPILGVANTKFVHAEGDTRDAVELMDYYTSGIGWGVFNVNEVRAKMGMAMVDGGDINGIMAPTGFVPLDRLNLFFRPPQTNVEDVPEDPRDPVSGEPVPKRTTDTEVGSGESRELVKSMLFPAGTQEQYDAALAGIQTILHYEGLQPRRKEIVKALAYFEEAKDVEPEFNVIYKTLRKLKDIDEEDVDLREGYFERIKDSFDEYIERREDDNYEAL